MALILGFGRDRQPGAQHCDVEASHSRQGAAHASSPDETRSQNLPTECRALQGPYTIQVSVKFDTTPFCLWLCLWSFVKQQLLFELHPISA